MLPLHYKSVETATFVLYSIDFSMSDVKHKSNNRFLTDFG